MIKERNYMWDNMKGVLIILVVINHFLKAFAFPAASAELWVYWTHTYHMPAFMFVSGFFAKRYCVNGTVRAKKLASFIGYYLVFQLLYYGVFQLLSVSKDFTLLDPYRGLWYLFALIVYYLLIPVFEKMKPCIALPVILLLGLFIGTEQDSGNFLAMSRICVFAPFFFAGYYTIDNMIEKLRNIKGRVIIGIACMAASIPLWMFASKFLPETWLNKNNVLTSTLFSGNVGYAGMGFSSGEGILIRLLSYLIAGLMTVGLIMVMPNVKGLVAHIGKNSIQVYMLHIPINMFFLYSGLFDSFAIDNIYKTLMIMVLSVVTAAILSTKPFSYPFKWIQMLVDKLFVKE